LSRILRCYKQKIRKLLIFFTTTFFLTACQGIFSDFLDGSNDDVCDTDDTSVSFKKVAYWDGDDREYKDEANYHQLDYLIYGYLEVNADGSLVAFDDDEQEDFEDMISTAQSEGVDVFISIGGDQDDSNFNTIAASSSLTNSFVDNVIEFLEDYDLDGVDLNWQTPGDDDEGELFEDLVEKLSDKLWDDSYEFSISVISGVGDDGDIGDVIDSTVFDYVDFVNVRAFDTDNSDDLHSSMEDAEDAIDYWTGRCLIQNKLVLGIPLYSAGDSVDSYNDIVGESTSNACKDEDDGRNYNGIPTVIDKTEYALSNAGGVMMMSLEQDSYENRSYLLLDVINETAAYNTVSICD
jgi:hypothetical protein